ncbi:adenylyltransferase/cytidyltransferase family protein [Xenorhabdus bovienii]|uniref:adenylyltransferase/cytidyltransferase family protein n=1 Tax=Xenorhabdus bovienii TaxID=40576 RepID=UPI0023B23C8F|nr:adenylyltransferase/cytidyltransferase family protein [Xenorhabdus bovienii]MDE9544458.1 adenylyltransferase/cytidyltransferase family protein [Xenorhabdus bovienii]MDE9566036.1 adenylyltransferase/cytidyltransferase family protein [Xenorhabdus bovienii]
MAVLSNITELEDLAKDYRTSRLTIGLCHGCFDIVHIGHIHHFQRASLLVDRLFVSITADKYVNKGADRPIFLDSHRAKFLASIRYCHHVIVNHTPTAEFMLSILRPNVFFKGADYGVSTDPRLQAERELVESHGGRIVFTDSNVMDSTSRIAKIIMHESM